MSQLKGQSVLIIGAGPTVIGQSGECDQGAAEACLALKGLGCRVIALNSNPDSPLTDPGTADRALIEPLTLEFVESILAEEKPTAVLPSFGGRMALSLAAELSRKGMLARYGSRVWGTAPQSLECLLDRDALKNALNQIDLHTPALFTFSELSPAAAKAQELGFPVVLRSDDAHLMPDGILVYNQEELRAVAAPLTTEPGFALSVEASLWRFRQLEIELLRDSRGTVRFAGAVEYIDPAVVHPGDALAVCPPQTISPDLLARMQDLARRVADHLAIVGGATVRLVYQPDSSAVLVPAVHPRYTRTSALTSLVSGRSLAGAAALLSAGCTWDQLPKALAADWTQADAPDHGAASGAVAVKWPLWNFENLPDVPDRLGPRMQAAGQSVGIGLQFREALQKAARGRCPGCAAIGEPAVAEGADQPEQRELAELLTGMAAPGSRRPFMIFEALRRGADADEISRRTLVHPWFIRQFKELVDTEERIRAAVHATASPLPPDLARRALLDGFSPEFLCSPAAGGGGCDGPRRPDSACLRGIVAGAGLQIELKALDHAGKRLFAAFGPRNGSGPAPAAKNIEKSSEPPALLILGSGPHGIGRGSECDWAVRQAAAAALDLGYAPLTVTAGLGSLPAGGPSLPGRVCCGPQGTADILCLADLLHPEAILTRFAAGSSLEDPGPELAAAGAPVAGIPAAIARLLADRSAFRQRIRELGIPQPAGVLCSSAEELRRQSAQIGFPLLISPVLRRCGEPQRLLADAEALSAWIEEAGPELTGGSFWLEKFLEYAIEAQVEALCDGRTARETAVLEHIELAGVNPADSAWVLPPYSIAPRHIDTMSEYTRKVAAALAFRGLLNARFAIYRDTVYLLEADCGTNRNLSAIAKITGRPVVGTAVGLMLNRPPQSVEGGSGPEPAGAVSGADGRVLQKSWVRAAVFPFNVFSQVDPSLGPEQRATGQVLATAGSFGLAYFKAMQAAGTPLPLAGTVLITVTDEDKPSILEPARIFQELGFAIKATRGTQAALAGHGIQAEVVRKLGFGRPNLVDDIKNGQVQLVINTPSGGRSQMDDTFIRKAAIRYRVAVVTTPASAVAAAKGIAARRRG